MYSFSVKTFFIFPIKTSVSLKPTQILISQRDLNNQSKSFRISRFFVTSWIPNKSTNLTLLFWPKEVMRFMEPQKTLRNQCEYRSHGSWNVYWEVRNFFLWKAGRCWNTWRTHFLTRFIDEFRSLRTSGVALWNFKIFQRTFQFARNTQNNHFHPRFIEESWSAKISNSRLRISVKTFPSWALSEALGVLIADKQMTSFSLSDFLSQSQVFLT